MIQLRCKRLTETAKLPTKAHPTDAGWDLYADEDVDGRALSSHRGVTITTNVAMEIPVGYFGLVRPRSSLSLKHGVQVLAGVIDAGYRDAVKVLLKANDTIPHLRIFSKLNIKKGDRIAQLVILPVPEVEIIEADFLNESERGNKGFGSSGV